MSALRVGRSSNIFLRLVYAEQQFVSLTLFHSSQCFERLLASSIHLARELAPAMKELLAVRVAGVLVVSLSLSIVCAAPTAEQSASAVRTTTTEASEAVTTEELEFKDVPIFEKDEPRKPAPPGTKYISVLKCGGHGNDAQHVSAPPTDGQRSQDGEKSPQTIHKSTETAEGDAPAQHQDKEDKQTAFVPDNQQHSQPVVVEEQKLASPASDSQILSDNKEADRKDVESIPAVEQIANRPTESDASNEPVVNILVVSDETGKLDVTIENGPASKPELSSDIQPEPQNAVDDPALVQKTPDEETKVEPESQVGNEQKPEDDKSTEKVADKVEESANNNDNFETNGEMIDASGEEPEDVKDFTGYKVYRVIIPTEEAARWILKFEDVPGVEFWADPKLLLRPRGLFVTSAADMLVAPDVTDYLEEAFKQARLPYEILIADVQEAIRNENPSEPLDVDELTSRNGHRLTWERYHTIDDIDSYLEYLKVTFPDFVTVTEIGKSTENRPIKAVRLHQKGGRSDKKSILIDAGIHAREWITPATITYMIREVVDNPQKYECIMNEFDWIFVPILNPDGYNYTQSHNRMWRKTRSPTDSIVFRKAAQASLTADRLSRFQDDPILDDAILEKLRSKVVSNKASLSCTGADANRNFDYHWLTGGSSRNPCSEIYAGPKPFSEPESRALRDLVLDNKDQLAMYISLHAYSQMWLIPWGYKQEKPEDFSDLYSLAKIGSKALQTVNGVDYMIGAIPDLLYVASGSSIDWVKGAVGVKYAFTLELRDSGRYGFLLPASQIVPSGKETWAAMYATAVELSSRLYSDPASCPAI